MTTTTLASSDLGPQFLSVGDGKKTIIHSIVGWSVDDNNKATPILYPEKKPDATLFYQNGPNQRVVTEVVTGKTFASIEAAIEAQP